MGPLRTNCKPELSNKQSHRKYTNNGAGSSNLCSFAVLGSPNTVDPKRAKLYPSGGVGWMVFCLQRPQRKVGHDCVNKSLHPKPRA